MATLTVLSVILLSSIPPALLARPDICQHKKGLSCFSKTILDPGTSYTIVSKTCNDGKYMKKENCAWYFDMRGCTPSIQCQRFNVKGCKGDKVTVTTDNGKNVFCGRKNVLKSFTEEKTTTYFDVLFKTNKRGQGFGFECSVSCSGEKPNHITTSSPVLTAAPPEAALPCKCGLPRRESRIFGGVTTGINEYPWQVGLIDPKEDLPFCGGSIISSKTILTAAHCTIAEHVTSFEVVVAEHDLTQDDGQERLQVCEKIEHPGYRGRTDDYDFSILTLCKPINFRRAASPVCLPQAGSSYNSVVSTVSGWGDLEEGGFQPDRLMKVNVTTMTNAECNEIYEGDILDSMLCAMDEEKDACHGDSGGPLITREPGNYYSQIGVVSWGVGCADPDYPGVYGRVTKVLPWIEKLIKGATCTTPHNLSKLPVF